MVQKLLKTAIAMHLQPEIFTGASECTVISQQNRNYHVQPEIKYLYTN